MDYDSVVALVKSFGLEIVEDITEEYHQGECVYWKELIRLNPNQTNERKAHVLLHELAHYTGVETLTNRDTLSNYDKQECYAVVEEMIAEATAIALQQEFGIEAHKGYFCKVCTRCDELGVEWDIDIMPEVQKAFNIIRSRYDAIKERK